MLTKIRKVRAILAKPADARSMSEKLAISTAFTSTEFAITIMVRLVSTLIVTRLLSPEIYGLFGVILAFQYIIIMLTDFGVRSLIIVAEDPRDPVFLKTCWSVQTARGVGIFGLVLVLSGVLWWLAQAGVIGGDTVYGAPELPAALAASGLQLVLQGAESVNQHVYAREMRYRAITIMNLIRLFVGVGLTIFFAWLYPSVWALVAASLVSHVLQLWLTFRLFEGPAMGISWHRGHVAELFDRGKWIMSHSGLAVLAQSADKMVLSAFLPSSVMGTYFLASQLVELPQNLIKRLQAAMSLQFFRELVEMDDRGAAQTRYYGYRAPFDVLACVITGGMITAAPAVIEIMYDPRYLDAGWIMQILALSLPFFTLGLIRDAFSAQKRFRLMTLMSVIQAVSIWVGLLVALPVLGSTVGAFLVVALHRIPEIATLHTLAWREGWISVLREVRFLPLIGVGAAMGYGVDRLWAHMQAG